MEEDHSELFNEIQRFSQRKLKKVETKVLTGTGDKVTEKRTAKGLAQLDSSGKPTNDEADQTTSNRKLDLQVGMVMPGLMIGSNDVAQDKNAMNEFAITHVLNLAPRETQSFRFEDDFNYLEVAIQDQTEFQLKSVLDKCFDFIDEGRFRGNCFVHCCTTKPGLSRSTAICIAYLMGKEKKSFEQAFSDVKEARAFVRPGDWFVKQLQEYGKEVNAKAEEKPAEDKFTAKKRQEIEEEKAMLKNAVNIRNKMNMWDKQVEQQQQEQQQQQQELERRRTSKSQRKFGGQLQLDRQDSVNTNATSTNRSEPRKLTSIMSIFQQKDDSPAEAPRNRIVLNTAPAKKWAPVTTNSLQRTVKPETKNFDFLSKVKRSKSREWKRDALKRTKSRGSCDPDPLEMPPPTTTHQQKPTFSTSAPPPPPPPVPSKQLPATSISARQPKSVLPTSTPIKSSLPPPPPPPPPPQLKSKPETKINVISSPAPLAPPPPPPPPSLLASTQSRPLSPYNNGKNVLQPQQSNSLKASPTASPNSSRSVSPVQTFTLPKPVNHNNNMLFNKPTSPTPPPPSKISAGTSKTTTPLSPAINHSQLSPNNRLDQTKMNRFNNGNVTPSMDKCVDYGRMAASKALESSTSTKPVVVRHIPIQREPTEEESEEEVLLEGSEEEEEEESSSEESSSSSSSDEESPQISSDPDGKGLTRSSTMEILKLIKAKNNDHEKLQVVEEEDEDKEIDMLLMGLQKEGVENIDWGEFGIELAEVKDIIKNNQDDEEEDEEEEDEESEEESEEEESD